MIGEKRTAEPAAHNRLHGIRVLVVEDENDPREFFREVLVVAGAEVSVAASARAALDIAALDIPHVLVSDIMMPGEDGYWLIKEIRALPQRAGQHRPRAVAVTGNAMTHSRDRVLGAGFDAHLSKPVSVDQLRSTVARLALVSMIGAVRAK